MQKLLSLFKPKREIQLPTEISDDEKIARSIFSPINVGKNNKLKSNAFKSPPEIDEVSVNRLSFTTSHFCKKISKKIASPENKRSYFGLAILNAKEIREFHADVIYSPILLPEERKNIFHADIKVGYKSVKNQESPAEINYIIRSLSNKARLYIDPYPEKEMWEGANLL